jgi:hypothetical protein
VGTRLFGGRPVRDGAAVITIVVSYLGRDLVEIEASTAVSENPTFTISFRATEISARSG